MTRYTPPSKANGWLVNPVEMAEERRERKAAEPLKYKDWRPGRVTWGEDGYERKPVTLAAVKFLEPR